MFSSFFFRNMGKSRDKKKKKRKDEQKEKIKEKVIPHDVKFPSTVLDRVKNWEKCKKESHQNFERGEGRRHRKNDWAI
jgi:hypothetical protein